MTTSRNNNPSGGNAAGTPIVAALNVYKKVAVIRRSTDTVTYEDAEGNRKTVSDLGEAASSATPLATTKPKLDIPVPRIKIVEDYDRYVPPTYKIPKSYVRYHRPSQKELYDTLEYNVDAEDEAWLQNNSKFGRGRNNDTAATSSNAPTGNTTNVETHTTTKHKKDRRRSISKTNVSTVSTTNNNNNINNNDKSNIKPESSAADDDIFYRRPQLPLDIFQRMMDYLEKATGFNVIITKDQAETLLISKIPQLHHIFPVNKRATTAAPVSAVASSRSAAVGSGVAGVGGNLGEVGIGTSGGDLITGAGSSLNIGGPSNSTTNASNAAMPTAKQVINDVYDYWVSKRSKLKRPLIRRFWPVTSCDDTNPHQVFRPREKEKYKLRNKRRQNDIDAYRKLKQLKVDFDHLRKILDLVRKREQLHREMIYMQCELYQQRLYDALDTSGKPRLSKILQKDRLDAMLEVPTCFDVNATASSSTATSANNTSSTGGKRGRKSGRRNSSTSPTVSATITPTLVISDAVGGTNSASTAGNVVFPTTASASMHDSNYDGSSPAVGANVTYAGGVAGAGVRDATTTATVVTISPSSNMSSINHNDFIDQSQTPHVVIAGRNNGIDPAPTFVHPLQTRETYITSWENAVPHVTSYIQGQPVPTFRFRHRPRVGRGGRLCIDRLPYPVPSNHITPITVYTAGRDLPRITTNTAITAVATPTSTSNNIKNGKNNTTDTADANVAKSDAGNNSMVMNNKNSETDNKVAKNTGENSSKEPNDEKQNKSMKSNSSTSNNLNANETKRQQGGNIAAAVETTTTVATSATLLDLLPRPLDTALISRRIEEICIQSIKDDMMEAGGRIGTIAGLGGAGNTVAGSTTSASTSNVAPAHNAGTVFFGDSTNANNAAAAPNAAVIDAEENDGEEILVKLDDWLDTDDQPWGEERFAIGPV